MSKKLPKILSLTFFTLAFLQLLLFIFLNLSIRPQPTSAADTDFPLLSQIAKISPFTGPSYPQVGEMVAGIYSYSIGFLGLLAAAVIMYGGILYLAAGGNQSRAGEGKKWIEAGLTGLVIGLCTYLILNTINAKLVQPLDLKVEETDTATLTLDELLAAYLSDTSRPTGGGTYIYEKYGQQIMAIADLPSDDPKVQAFLESLEPADMPTTAPPNTGKTTVPPEKINEWIEEYAKKYGLDPNLIRAVMRTESNFDPNAESGAGAKGLMQLMPATAKGLGVNIDDPEDNVNGGAKYLRQLLDMFDEDLRKALSGYNMGPYGHRRNRRYEDIVLWYLKGYNEKYPSPAN